MFDLAGFLSLLDELEKKRKRSAALSSWRQMEDDIARLRPKQKPGPKPRAKPSTVSGKPKTGGKPRTGSTPVSSSTDDELRKRRGGAGGRASSANAGIAPASRTPQSAAGAYGSSSVTVATPVERSAIAAGSQAAVVKLVSFAAGQQRIGALLTYQSRAGEVSAEDEAGQRLEGSSWVQEIADEWSEDDGRQPSKDVLRLSITVPADRFGSDSDVGLVLKQALAGHRIAWRSQEDGEQRRVDVVVSSAARRHHEEAKSSRIYDNRKSLTGLDRSLRQAFGNEAYVDVHGFAHGVEGVARYLGQLRKGGRHEVHSARPDHTGGFASDVVLASPTSAVEEARDWKRDLRSQERRDVAHIVLSAKPGASREAFVAASRAMLAREFEGHRYVFALHEDRDHLHVHAVVKMRSETGERMHPRIQDFKRWRQTLAEEARLRDIPMDAVSRFERANPPGFKMRDIRRVERGEASEAVRRRVDAVRHGAIHVPTREEGRRRAELTARAWSETLNMVSSANFKPEPPQRPGAVRLYRCERPGQSSSSQPLFTRDRAAAAQIAVRHGGTLRYIEIAADQLYRLTPSRKDPLNVFVVDRNMAALAEPISPEQPAEIIRLQERAAIAAGRQLQRHIPESVSAITGKDPDMADLSVMKTSFEQMDASLDTLEKTLPGDKMGEFATLRRKVKANQQVMLEAQQAIEKKRGGIEGDTYVAPKPVELRNFVAEARGDDVRYSHRKTDGRAGAVAFTDHGDKVEIGKWNDREVVLAAMQVASGKWGSLSLSGTSGYKALAIELAAEHGFKITNPELQDQLNAARERVASRTEKAAIAAGGQVQSAKSVTDAAAPVGEKPSEARTEAPAVSMPVTPIDDGQKIKPVDRDRDSMLAAMKQASEKWGAIGVNGTEREKAMAVEIAAEHGIALTNPELQDKLTEAREKVEERRQKEAAREEKRLGFVEGSAAQAPVLKTDAEIAVGLQVVREEIQAETRREVNQARRSAETNERPFEGGGEDHAYRTRTEAKAAASAGRSVDDNPSKPIPMDINQSAEIERHRQTQQQLLDEKEEKQRNDIQRQVERSKPRQRQ